MRFSNNTLLALGALALGLVGYLSPPVSAQTVPSSNPTYIPTAVSATQTLAATGAITWNANNFGTSMVQVAGTYTGLVGTFQVTPDRGSSPTWTTVHARPVGNSASGTLATITANGLYAINTAGAAQVRFNVTGLSTGSVTATFSGTPAIAESFSRPVRRVTYSATSMGITTAASATDIFTITGSATKTISVYGVSCSGIATTAGTADLQLIRRSTANSAGTSTAPTIAQHDSSDAAATATVLAYTANPTTGTAAGAVGSAKTPLPLASVAVVVPKVNFEFGSNASPVEPIVLRGITQVLAVNGNGATLAAGASLNCTVTWAED